MTNFDMPVGLTDEALNDNGVSRLFTEVVPCSAIEFHDRESVTVNGTSLFISQDEAVPELGVFTGLGRGKTLAKLPDELFAYDLNYLFRRSEADASIVYDENGTMVGVNMADLFRLSTESILTMLTETTNASEAIRFDRSKGFYSISLLGGELRHPSAYTGDEPFGRWCLGIQIDDKLEKVVKVTPEVWLFNGSLVMPFPYLTTKASKNDTAGAVLDRVEEIIGTGWKAMPSWFEERIAAAASAEVEFPRKFIEKLLHENKMGKAEEDILDAVDLSQYEEPTRLAIALELGKASALESLNNAQRTKMAGIAGSVFVSHEDRCEHCLSVIDESLDED